MSRLVIADLESLVRFEHEAMATKFEFHLGGADRAELRAAAQEAFALIDRLEDQLSFYREASDVTRINRATADTTLRVREGTLECLLTALDAAADTDGAFDPFLGVEALRAKNQTVPPHLADLTTTPAQAGPTLAVSPADSTVTKLTVGRWLDLGAVGKGHALDAAAAQLQDWGVPLGLLVAGGSSIVGFSRDRTVAPPWSLRMEAEPRSSRQLHLTTPFALGASGHGFQPGHVIAPARRANARRPRVWLQAPTAALADALSTGAMLMSDAELAALVAARPEIACFAEPSESGGAPFVCGCFALEV